LQLRPNFGFQLLGVWSGLLLPAVAAVLCARYG
jgi:hypothetical protein